MHHIKYTILNKNLPEYIQVKETNNKINGRIQIDSTASPNWVTPEGNIGSFLEQEAVNISIQANIGASGGTTIRYGLLPPIGLDATYLPLGLTINNETGAITGTVVETKTDPVNIKNFNDSEEPLWNDTSYYIGKFNEKEDVNFTLASATPRKGTTIKYFLKRGYLPLGLHLNGNTCAITGNTGQVMNDFTIPASPEPKPRWNTLAGMVGKYGEFEAVNITIQATPMRGTTLAYFIKDGALPLGLSLDRNTGVISGVTGENMNPNDVVVFGPDAFSPIFTTATHLGNFTHGDTVSLSVNANAQSDRTITAYTVYTKASDSDGLPVGLTMDRLTGAISGTISAINPAGTYPVTIRAHDNTGRWTTKVFTVSINEPV